MSARDEIWPPHSKFWFFVGRLFWGGFKRPKPIKRGGLISVPEDYVMDFTKETFTKALRPAKLPTEIGPYEGLKE